MDQITLIGPPDMESMRYHAALSFRHIRFLDRIFYIIPNDKRSEERVRASMSLLLPEERDRIVIVNESDVVDPAVCANKWVYQQLLKLSLDVLQERYHISEPFLITDVDTLCLRPLEKEELMHDGKYIFWVAHYQKADAFFAQDFNAIQNITDLKSIHKEQVSWLMGFTWTTLQLLSLPHMQCMSAVNACVLWYGSILRDLKKQVEENLGKPFFEAIKTAYSAFVCEHIGHIYEYMGFRKYIMTYYPDLDMKPVNKEPHELIDILRIGFSEWQLYLYYLSIANNHPYNIYFHRPNQNAFIGEFNTEVLSVDVFNHVLKKLSQRSKQYCFINFYPNLSPALAQRISYKYHLS